MRVLVIGEVLWDVFPDAERLGGAPFNFAAHLRKLGHDVLFVSGIGDDERGRSVLRAMAGLGLETWGVSTVRRVPTGYVSVFLDAAGKPDFEIHRPAAYLEPKLSDGSLERIAAWQPEWIYTGTLAQASATVRSLTERIAGAASGARRFYDVNLRKGCYTAEVVQQLLSAAEIVKLNDSEAEALSGMLGYRFSSLEAFCRGLRDGFGSEIVCVTRGANGCAVLDDSEYFELAGFPVKVVDTVGAGDAFGAGLLHGLSRGWGTWLASYFANRLGAFVASRAGAIPDWTLDDVAELKPAQ